MAIPDRQGLAAWLASAGFDLAAAHPLAGDVSPRRYHRLTAPDGRTAILALYPDELAAACERFARTTDLLTAAAVPVPAVLATACERGAMLVEDLGERTLAEHGDRPWSELHAWFEHAVALAARIAALPADRVRDLNPPLDQALMARELEQTRTLLLEPRGMTVPGLDPALDALCRALAADPPVPCHRDFMARNLVPIAPGRVAVLDHQDLRLGPPAYDLASLLNDTLFPPPDAEDRLLDLALVGAVATAAGNRAAAAALAGPSNPADPAAPAGPATPGTPASHRDAFRRRYHRAAAQRTLKAAGTFAAFARRGADRYLPLIGPTLTRFVAHFGRVPEGEILAPRLTEAWAAMLR